MDDRKKTAAAGGRLGAALRLVRAVTSRLRKADGAYALERVDPIRGLTARQAQAVFDLARGGSYAQIQRIYAEVERTDPTLLVCVMRRAAALSELDWKVVQSDQRLVRGATEADVTAQVEWLETLCARIDNLAEAVEFLSTAAFRGFANVSPVYRADGSVRRLDLLDQWNLCWDRRRRTWLWNPEAAPLSPEAGGFDGLEAIPRDELVTVTERAPIDWPALMVYLRRATAEHDWGVFVERYGIPPVVLTMPDGISEEDVPRYVSGVEEMFNGRSGVVPFGTVVNYAAESRGVDPFSAFIEHQQRLVVLMATGGLLTSLAESGSGTLAGGAHERTWRTIVRRDARIVAEALNKQLFERLVRAAFPGQPVLAEFKFETTPDPTPKEVFELAVLARNAGLEMKPEEIAEMTGYTLAKAEPPPQGGLVGAGTDAAGMAGMGAGADGGAVALNARETRPDAHRTPRAASGRGGGLTDAGRLAIALRADFAAAAEAVEAVLAVEDEAERRAKARETLARLDDLVPDDPVMAGVIADTMAREFLGAREGA